MICTSVINESKLFGMPPVKKLVLAWDATDATQTEDTASSSTIATIAYEIQSSIS